MLPQVYSASVGAVTLNCSRRELVDGEALRVRGSRKSGLSSPAVLTPVARLFAPLFLFLFFLFFLRPRDALAASAARSAAMSPASLGARDEEHELANSRARPPFAVPVDFPARVGASRRLARLLPTAEALVLAVWGAPRRPEAGFRAGEAFPPRRGHSFSRRVALSGLRLLRGAAVLPFWELTPCSSSKAKIAMIQELSDACVGFVDRGKPLAS
ncbi:hypothetical protein BZA05DRAFT_260325 [Tricharina praecox]|uniref:uncharacterized protein n=1 Tax=Tricharina praecox TaxID=43433 RepID=UPI00221ECB0D|nr:uncharacterized protein BZA05DRAFT_260325 [Tricharina praecox]KAI5854220.1 hypothetical protein BZA05DRAFT_260325 [Tricharina praecox]